MKIIARIKTPFSEKFGIPRQSGIVEEIVGRVVFEPEYRIPDAIRGIEGYSHLWLIWQFSEAIREDWSPTVRPPRLGGNKRMGVFATRSPFRPNPIGLSCVKLLGVEDTAEGPVLVVGGADILDGTPIYDIKPYLSFTDCHPEAVSGFADGVKDYKVEVEIEPNLLEQIPVTDRGSLIALLSQDPRPAYKGEGDKEYAMKFYDFEVFFIYKEGKITVTRIEK